MPKITLSPDLKTAGGEFCDIMVDGQFAGTLTLVYREGDRIAGSIQLEEESIYEGDKEDVISHLQDYIQSFIRSVGAESCDVLVTYSNFDRIVTTGTEEAEDVGEIAGVASFADDDRLDFDMTDLEERAATDVPDIGAEDLEPVEYELVVVNETGERIEYQVYDADEEFIAEAFLQIGTPDVTGTVTWQDIAPQDEEIELVTELLVTDFDEDTVDSFVIHHKFDGQIVDTVELVHEDLLDTPTEVIGDQTEEDYSVILARDDGDVLTYEIYQQSKGGLPIGTATVDIQHRRLTGFIDFRDKNQTDDAEAIAALLMRELDKEKDYEGLNLTLMYQNEAIDEFVIDNDPVH